MLRSALCGTLFVLTLAPAGLASDPQITQLRTQIRLLRDRQREMLAAVKARYTALVKQTYKSEKELARERIIAKAEEKQLLALAAGQADKEKVRKAYEALAPQLRLGVKLDKEGIRQLKAQEKLLSQHVKVIFGTQIQQLENQLVTLQQVEKLLKKR